MSRVVSPASSSLDLGHEAGLASCSVTALPHFGRFYAAFPALLITCGAYVIHAAELKSTSM